MSQVSRTHSTSNPVMNLSPEKGIAHFHATAISPGKCRTIKIRCSEFIISGDISQIYL